MSSNTNRAEINRANSQHSTGPRTDAGKARSAMNALKHGLSAKAIVLPGEDPAAYQRHIDSYMNEYKPATPAELQQVHFLADTSWQLQRVGRLENKLFSPFDENLTLDSQMRSLATLGMHRHRLSRDFDRTLRELKQAQHDRRKQERFEVAQASKLYAMDEDQGNEYDPSVDGFVCSRKEVETYLLRKNRFTAAVRHSHEQPDDEEEENNSKK